MQKVEEGTRVDTLQDSRGRECALTDISHSDAALISGQRSYQIVYSMEFDRIGLPVSCPPQYYVPKSERSNYKLYNVDYKFGEERLSRFKRSDPTRELNFTAEHWNEHKSPYRKWRHLMNTFHSSTFQRLLFPDLLWVASVAALLTYYNHFVTRIIDESNLHLNMAGFAVATISIGLLATFRLNSSYRRYEECRIFWGETINASRDLGGSTMMWMKDKAQRARMLKLIKAFPVCFNFHVNCKGGHHVIDKATWVGQGVSWEDRIQAEFQAELLDIYMDGSNDGDLRRLCQLKYMGGNVGLQAMTLMRETIAASVGTVDPIYVSELNQYVQRLCSAFGGSERVLRTPLPTSFTRLASRILFTWDFLVPFFVYPFMGPYLTIPAAVFTSYAVLSIEDVGVQMEVFLVLYFHFFSVVALILFTLHRIRSLLIYCRCDNILRPYLTLSSR